MGTGFRKSIMLQPESSRWIMPRNLVAVATLGLLLALPVAAGGADRAAEAINGAQPVRPSGNPAGAGDRTVGASPSSQLSRQEDRVIIEDRTPAVVRKTCIEEPRQRECAEMRR
jgi:hypothetical protein